MSQYFPAGQTPSCPRLHSNLAGGSVVGQPGQEPGQPPQFSQVVKEHGPYIGHGLCVIVLQ